ncbi:protein of unknown function [Rhodovastum atsumiense]|nr:protein of unknown function [Rhodovastum atsumiense]
MQFYKNGCRSRNNFHTRSFTFQCILLPFIKYFLTWPLLGLWCQYLHKTAVTRLGGGR